MMERQHDDTPPPRIEVIRGHRPPEEVRDYAFELWAWKHKQSASAVAHELGIEPRTVQRWAKDDNWRVRYEEQRGDLSPHMARYTTALILGSAAPKAAARLEAMIDGTIPPDKTLAVVCQMVLDRVGFSPIGLRRNVDPSNPPRVEEDASALPDFAAMTAEERRDWEITERERIRGLRRRRDL